jgi:hypothetical protein
MAAPHRQFVGGTPGRDSQYARNAPYHAGRNSAFAAGDNFGARRHRCPPLLDNIADHQHRHRAEAGSAKSVRITRAPLECFTQAIIGLASRVGVAMPGSIGSAPS